MNSKSLSSSVFRKNNTGRKLNENTRPDSLRRRDDLFDILRAEEKGSPQS